MSTQEAVIQSGTIEFGDAHLLPASPVVSVLMLVYNHRESLAQAIESVLAQETGFPIELLIGEDHSTDGSREIAIRYQQEHPGTIRVLTAARNVGAYQNYMRLLDAARGEFVAHIDGDDYWLLGKLTKQVALLREHREIIAVYGNAHVLGQDGALIGRFNNVGDERLDLGAVLRRGNFLCMSTMVFRASQSPLIRAIGGVFIDYQMHLTHAQHGDLIHLAEPLAVYRLQSTGSMVANDNARVRELYWQAVQSVPRDRVTDGDYARGLADFLRRVAFRAVRARRWRLFGEWSARVQAASPYGVLRTGALVATSILRTAFKEGVGWVMCKAGGHRGRILYRR